MRRLRHRGWESGESFVRQQSGIVWEFGADLPFSRPAKSANLIRVHEKGHATFTLASMQSQKSGWSKGNSLSPYFAGSVR